MLYEPKGPFSAWTGPRNASMVFVGEAFSNSENELRKPFAGEGGKELFRMLREALPDTNTDLSYEIEKVFQYGNAWVGRREPWFQDADIGLTSTFNFQPYGNKISEVCVKKAELPAGYSYPPIEPALYLEPKYLPELDRLRAELLECKPNIVVACGAKATWALLGDSKITSMRGTLTESTLVPGLKVLPTFHPFAVLRQWSWRSIVIADIAKAARERTSSTISRPSRNIIYSPTLVELRQWISETLAAPPPMLACDTETEKGQVSMISFARSPSDAIVIPFIDSRYPGHSFWPTAEDERAAWDLIDELFISPIPKLWQNGLYDLQYLLPLGLHATIDEDTMLRHHSIFPEMKKNLGFLGSIYTNEPAWKLMRTEKADTEKRDE